MYLHGVLCPAPAEKMCDANGRPYLLWDSGLTLPEFLAPLHGAEPEERRYWMAHLLRQAKPDDARQIVDLATQSYRVRATKSAPTMRRMMGSRASCPHPA